MSNPFDQFDGANASASNPFDQFDAPPANKKLNKGIAGDLVTDLKRGVEQLPSIVTGLADIPVAAITGKPLVGQAADTMGGITGFAPSKWAKEAEAEYSPGRVEAKRNVDQAWEDNKTPFADAAGGDFRGIGQIAKSYIQNPQQLVGSVVESLPSMVAGGAISKGLIATKTLGTGAGIMAGEGSIMAGQQMDKLSQTEADPRTAAAASAVTGIVGGGLGLVGGKVASKLGVIDPDVALATGTMRGVTDQAKDQTVKGMVKEGAKRVAGGAVSEGAFEELPQSVLEQVLSNLAQSKPWDEGVSRAAVEGTLAGALMGGAFNVIPPKQEKKADAPPAADTPEEKPMLALPAPTYTGTPGDQIVAADAERQAAIDKAQAESNAIWAARDEYERQQAEYRKRPMPTITNDPEPIQQRIDALMGINEARLQGFARTNYEKALENAFAEQIGFVSGKDSREIPFTMGDYLKSKVAAADIDRKGAARQPAPAGITAAPVIPVVGTLSAAANIAVQSGAHAATVANQQQASEGFKTGQTWRKGNQSYTIESVSPDGKAGKANFGKGESFAVHFDTEKANGWSAEQNSQAEAISTKPGKADTPTTGNREAAPQLGILAGIAAQAPSIAQSAPNTQPQGQGGMPATAQQVVPAATSPAGVEFDVSKRTNQQLEHLSQHGQPGWKEAAVAEIAKRGAAAPTANSASVPALKASDSAKAPEIPNGDGVTDKPGTAPSGVAPADDGGIKQAPEARKESRGLSVGAMPNTAESVTVKDGVVHIGKYPAQNFDTGEDVTVPAGATDQQIVAALKDAGAISPKHKVFGAEKEAQPAPEDTIGWTRMPTVEREALVAKAGWTGKTRGINLGGAIVAKQAWGKMSEANRAKLVAASQNAIKNESPAAATGSAEMEAPKQGPIKSQSGESTEMVDAELPPNFDPDVEYAKRPDGSYKTKGEYTPEEWAAYTKSVIDKKLSQQKNDATPEAKQDKAPAINLGDKKVGDILEMGNGNRYRIEGTEGDKVRTTRNPDQLNERSVLLGQSEFDKLAADDAETRKENAATAERVRAESAQAQASKPDEDTRFAKNTIFTADKVAAAKARMKAKLGTINSGIDPELLIDGMTVAGAYIEAGVRKFADYAKAMVEDLGDGVKPYLLSFYEAARAYPGLNKLGMDTQEAAAEQHQALLTPEVKTAAKEVIGESPKVEKKKPANLGESIKLKADWGVQNIDGYTPSKAGKNQQTDYGLKGGVKDEFLADASRYLKAVAKLLESKGFTTETDKKGKAKQSVSINEGGLAVGGDVYLNMSAGDFHVYAQVGVTNVRGMGPEHPQGVSLMVRSGQKNGMNNWLSLDLTAGDLAAWFHKQHQAFAKRSAEVQPAAPAKASYDLSKADDKFKVATEIAGFLIGGGEFKTIIEARKKISEMIGRPIEAATELAKQADETIETAVVLAGRDIVKAGRKQGRTPEVIFSRLVDLYRRQPNLAVRSSTSVRDQAYSTPVPLAYLASELAGITYDTKVLEPTAGNGMLLIGASIGNSVVNELNPDRADVLRSLGFNPTERNAATEQLRHAGYPVDAVIANPPFGATKDANGETIVYDIKPGFKTREVDHAIVFKSLETMKDDGRAVLIVGGVQAEAEEARREDYRGANKRAFYFNLYNEYNVIDHFTVDGGLYSKQGASYPVDIIVIDGRGKSSRDMPAADLPVIFKSYDALKEKLNGNGRVESEPVVGAGGTDGGNGQARNGDTPAVAGSPVGSSVKDGNGSAARVGAASVRNDGPADNGRPSGSGAVSSGGQSESANASGSVDGSRVSDANRNAEAGSKAGNRGNRPDDLGGISVVNGERVESGLTDRRGQEQETGHQVAYDPHSNAASVGTLVPRAMKDSIAASLQKISDEVGSIDDYVAESLAMDLEDVKANFSAEQIDALALSIRNAEAGKGFIIGDQTGIGKGRVVAAMIRYALVTGKTPIFVTEKPNLYSDMIRDLDDIGMTAELALDTKNPKVMITNGGESIPYTLLRTENGEVVENNLLLRAPKSGKALDQIMQGMMEGDSLGEYKVIFTTYSQLQTVKGATTTRQRFIQKFGEGNYMVFDESHNAGGAGDTQARTKEQRQAAKDGESLVTGRASFVRHLVQKAFGTFFSSATYAKRPDVMDLYSSTNMKLAVDKISQLGEAIKSGGVPMQQVVANMLTKDGQYIRRERTFAGVSYDTQETKVDKGTAENMASAMRSILAFSRAKDSVIKEIQKEMDREGGMINEMGGEKSSVQGANFGSIMHNLIDQMLLSLKVQDSVSHAIERLKAGEKVVLTVSNTMGSFLKDYSEELGIATGDPVSMSFADLYNRYLEKQRNVTIKDGGGNKRQHRLTDAELGPRLVDMFNAVRKQIESSGFGSAPISPIDYMHNELRKAGYKTDEITGRTIALNYSSGTPILASRTANIRQRVKAVSGFNNGETDVLILNQAGSTGLSLHASSKFKDQRKRHMIIVQAEKNIDTHMQMLGRVHRTGQVVAPAYSQMMADIPAEMRPASVLMKKMASLNANTTASRTSSVTAEGVVDFMNNYGGQVVHEYLRDNPDVLEAVGGPDVMKLTEDSEDGNEDDIRKFTGYVPILPIKMQEEIYRDLIDRYNDLIERENSLGTNKLEAKAVDLDAETLSAQPITEKKEEQSAFASPAVMEKVDVKRSVKPYSSEEVAAIVKERLGDKTAREIASEQKLELRDKASAFARERIAKMQADGADPIKVDMHKSQLNLIYSHTNSILDTYSIGDPVSIKDQNGQFLYGVVTDIQTNGKTANPAAGSAWKMTFAIANGDAKSITMNFSQLGSKYEVRAANIVDWYNIETQSAERVPLMSLFDKGATVRREKRWIITGNLLAGYSRLPGQIITYTKKDGTSAQGILMSRQFDFEKEMKNAPVLVKSGAEAVKLFNGIGNGASLGTKDRSLMITDRNGRYELTVPSSKKDGGTYFLDQGITDIVGDLYKRGSIMSANVYGDNMLGRLVNYLINDRQEVIVALAQPEKAKQILRGEQGPGNIAERQASLSAADKAIYGMVAEGKNTADILKFIASASRNPLNRQLAKLLLKTGIAPQVMASTAAGWKFNAGNDKKYAAAYNPNTDTISLFRPAAAERNFLHEAMHAATLRALGKKGMAAAQMRALFNHVKKSGMLKGMYGMSDVDEFIAEAFSNPKFQAALKQVSAAPVGGKPSSAWDWFIRVVRGILGLKQGQDNALSQALDIGIGVMRENMRLNESAGDVRYNAAPGKINQTDTEAFKRWFGDSKVVDSDGKPLRVFHGTASDITAFDIGRSGESTGNTGFYGAGAYFSEDADYASGFSFWARRSDDQAPNVVPVYLSLKNPAYINITPRSQAASEKSRATAEKIISTMIARGTDQAVVDKLQGFVSENKFEPFMGTLYNALGGGTGTTALLKEAGFDGVTIYGGISGKEKLAEAVAFDPTQIKSAIGNYGDFDGSNPDIRYNVSDEGWSVAEPSKMDDVIYALQDKQIDMKRVVQSIMKTGKQIKDDFNAYLQEELFHGRAAKGVKDFLDFELRPLLAEMQKAGIDMGDFEEYLWNRHAPERNAQIAKINPDMPDGGSGIETAKARAYLAGLSAEQRKTFEALAAKVEAMNRESQRVLIESGLEKQSTIDAWNNAYQHYVPLQREDVDSGHVGTGKGFSVRGSSTKRAMGSGRQVVDIIANLAMQRERNIVRAEKNRVSNALLGLAVQNPNPEFWKVDQAPKERVVEETAIYTVRDESGKKLDEFTRMDEAERFARQHPGSDIEQTWGDRVKERVTPGFTSRDNVLLTRINGEDHYVIFNERDERAVRMAMSMKNLDVDNMGRVLSVVGKATRYLASVNTQYNPVFGVINLIRDAQGALINLTSTPLAGEQKRVLGYTVDALRGIYADIRAHRKGEKPSSKWAALFEEFQKEGGQTGYRDQYANSEARAEAIKSELEQFKEGKAKQFTRGIFGWLSDYNETMENAVRLAAYKAAKEKGMSNQQAASLAKNITVNFNRKGQMATQVGALYAFFNASVQGTARIAETLFEQRGGELKNVRLSKVGKKIVAGGIMLGSMQAMLLAAAGFDDDEPPEFIRERNLILPIGDGKYLTMAMPLGFHVIPGIGRIATEFVLSGGKDPIKRMASFASMFAESFNPIGSSGFSLQTITPSVVDPFAALAENKDFTGKEIYREDFNKLNPTPGHARAKDVATFYSRWISEALNFITGGTEFKPGLISWSPDSIDYLVAQAGGGVMREANKVFQTAGAAYSGEDLPLYKIPLAGRFIGDTEGQSGQSAKFYEAIKQINMHEAEYKGLIKDGKAAEAKAYMQENPAVKMILAGNHVEQMVRKLRNQKRALLEGDAPSAEVSAIEDRIARAMTTFNERYAMMR